MPAKNKIFIAIGAWLVVSASMFGYFFKIFNKPNSEVVQQISEQKQQLAVLEAQRESFKLAQQDLKNLAQKPYQPDNFFSRDVTLVKEIETLENLGNKYQVDFSLGGLSGTVKSAAKAKTLGDIATIPYSISLVGPFPRVVDFVETMENLQFITHLTTLSVSNGGATDVSASMTANFYLRKQ